MRVSSTTFRGTKATHDAAKTFTPVTGAKYLAFVSEAQNKKLLAHAVAIMEIFSAQKMMESI